MLESVYRPFRFVDLPCELRFAIVSYLSRSQQLQLIRVNKEFYEVFLEVIYREITPLRISAIEQEPGSLQNIEKYATRTKRLVIDYDLTVDVLISRNHDWIVLHILKAVEDTPLQFFAFSITNEVHWQVSEKLVEFLAKQEGICKIILLRKKFSAWKLGPAPLSPIDAILTIERITTTGRSLPNLEFVIHEGSDLRLAKEIISAHKNLGEVVGVQSFGVYNRDSEIDYRCLKFLWSQLGLSLPMSIKSLALHRHVNKNIRYLVKLEDLTSIALHNVRSWSWQSISDQSLLEQMVTAKCSTGKTQLDELIRCQMPGDEEADVIAVMLLKVTNTVTNLRVLVLHHWSEWHIDPAEFARPHAATLEIFSWRCFSGAPSIPTLEALVEAAPKLRALAFDWEPASLPLMIDSFLPHRREIYIQCASDFVNVLAPLSSLETLCLFSEYRVTWHDLTPKDIANRIEEMQSCLVEICALFLDAGISIHMLHIIHYSVGGPGKIAPIDKNPNPRQRRRNEWSAAHPPLYHYHNEWSAAHPPLSFRLGPNLEITYINGEENEYTQAEYRDFAILGGYVEQAWGVSANISALDVLLPT